jgi:succinyl-diaminopimelate desuccinylase
MEPVDLLRELLRIRSINPPGDEAAVVAVLESYLSDAGLKTEILTSPGGRANLIARVDGPQDRPALVLLSAGREIPSALRSPMGASGAGARST